MAMVPLFISFYYFNLFCFIFNNNLYWLTRSSLKSSLTKSIVDFYIELSETSVWCLIGFWSRLKNLFVKYFCLSRWFFIDDFGSSSWFRDFSKFYFYSIILVYSSAFFSFIFFKKSESDEWLSKVWGSRWFWAVLRFVLART